MADEIITQCTEMIFVGGEWHQCTCFKGKGHDSSDFDHIVHGVSVLSTEYNPAEFNTFKRVNVTITWQ